MSDPSSGRQQAHKQKTACESQAPFAGYTTTSTDGSQRCFSKEITPELEKDHRAVFGMNGNGCIFESGPIQVGYIKLDMGASVGVNVYNIQYNPDTYTLILFNPGVEAVIRHADPDTGYPLRGQGTPCGYACGGLCRYQIQGVSHRRDVKVP